MQADHPRRHGGRLAQMKAMALAGNHGVGGCPAADDGARPIRGEARRRTAITAMRREQDLLLLQHLDNGLHVLRAAGKAIICVTRRIGRAMPLQSKAAIGARPPILSMTLCHCDPQAADLPSRLSANRKQLPATAPAAARTEFHVVHNAE